MKKIFVVLTVIFLVFLCAIAARNSLARFALLKGVKSGLDLDMSIKKIDVGILKTYVNIEDMKICNPPGFNEKIMADLPQVYVNYQPGAFFAGQVHLNKLRLELKEFVVEKNQQGNLNVNSIKGLKNKKIENQQRLPANVAAKSNLKIKIDSLELKIGTVVYKDYTQTPAAISTYQIGIDEKYENITDVNVLVKLIVARALVNTAISRLSGLDLNGVNKDLSGIFKNSEGIFKNLGNAGFDTIDSVTKQLENILK